MSARELRDRLRRRAKRAGVDLTPELAERLERYYALLSKWNAKINLTSFRLEPAGQDEAVDRLLIEPLVAARHVPPEATTVIDIGSGGGSPAIPLALAAPRLHLRMVESKTRKAVFLREAVRELDLGRGEVETSRFEELLDAPGAARGPRSRDHSRRARRAADADEPTGVFAAWRSACSCSAARRRPTSPIVTPPLTLAGDIPARRRAPLPTRRPAKSVDRARRRAGEWEPSRRFVTASATTVIAVPRGTLPSSASTA